MPAGGTMIHFGFTIFNSRIGHVQSPLRPKSRLDYLSFNDLKFDHIQKRIYLYNFILRMDVTIMVTSMRKQGGVKARIDSESRLFTVTLSCQRISKRLITRKRPWGP
jgi:hypothetical protein